MHLQSCNVTKLFQIIILRYSCTCSTTTSLLGSSLMRQYAVFGMKNFSFGMKYLNFCFGMKYFVTYSHKTEELRIVTIGFKYTCGLSGKTCTIFVIGYNSFKQTLGFGFENLILKLNCYYFRTLNLSKAL